MPRSVVTGAAGFVGSHIVDRLLDLGHDVIGVDCYTDFYDRELKERNLRDASAHASFRLVERDLVTIDLAAILEGADYVFHQAGQAGVRPSWGTQFVGYIRNNIEATQRLLEAARDARLKRFVFASSSSIYGNAADLPATERTIPAPISPYGVTKLAAEHLCSLYAANYGMPAISLRYFTVYGPRQRPDMSIQQFLTAIRNGMKATLFGDGTQTRDFTFVDDVVDANLLAIEADTDERALNICGGARISMNDLIALIENAAGNKLQVDREDTAAGDARHTFGDSSLARATIGYAPKTTVAEGVARQWAWLTTQAS